MSGPRFSILPGRAAADSRMTLSVLRVLSALGRHTNTEGWCFINQGRLGRELGISRQAVNTAVKRLVEWDYLEKRATRRKDGGNGVCDYRVKLDQEADCEPADLSPPDDTPLSSDDLTGVVTSEPYSPLSTPDLTTGTTHEGTSHINDMFGADFEEWWADNPNKLDKKKAKAAYRKALKVADPKTLKDAYKRYLDWCDTPPKTFLKHPTTWLNGENWTDDLPPKGGKAAPVLVDDGLVTIRHGTANHKSWGQHYAEKAKLTGARADLFKADQYNLDKDGREVSLWPPDSSDLEKRKPAKEAAE